jgi:predicted site-specific integrase-resolvase
MPESSESYPDDAFVDLRAGAALVGISPRTLRGWADAGLVPVYRTPTGHRRFKPSELRASITPEQRPGQPAGKAS